MELPESGLDSGKSVQKKEEKKKKKLRVIVVRSPRYLASTRAPLAFGAPAEGGQTTCCCVVCLLDAAARLRRCSQSDCNPIGMQTDKVV